jgi:CubicO group peptidase (beta-lactamase class C family)
VDAQPCTRRRRPARLLAFLLIFAATTSLYAPAAGAGELSEKDVWKIVSPLFIHRQGKGLAVGLISASGKTVYSFGKIGGKRSKPPNNQTVFEIGSITKTFTGALLAIAQMEGRIDLTDKIAPHLPEGVIPPGSPLSSITFLDLAAHSSGLPERPGNLPSHDPLNPLADYTRPLLYEYLKTFKPSRPPGQTFEYSNLGAGLAGVLLSRIYGKSFEELVREKICAPLGMLDTRVTMSESMRRNYAPGHNQKLAPVPAWDVPVLEAAGGLRSTADDLLTYAAANLGLVDSPIRPALLLSHLPRFHVSQAPELFIGLFWNVYNFKEHRYVIHAGRSGGFFALILLDPARKTGVVLLSNAEGDLTRYGWEILEKLGRSGE